MPPALGIMYNQIAHIFYIEAADLSQYYLFNGISKFTVQKKIWCFNSTNHIHFVKIWAFKNI